MFMRTKYFIEKQVLPYESNIGTKNLYYDKTSNNKYLVFYYKYIAYQLQFL